MALFSWFSKKKTDEDYEQILASLALSIQKRQTRLSELRLRERRSTLLVTAWTFAAWAVYVALWWAGVIGKRSRALRGALWGMPVVLGPIVILFTRRIVQLWYTRKGNAEEKTLKELMVQQRNKLEEIKKKTNYYSTKSLLDRYDESAAGSKSANGPPSPRRGPTSPVQPSQPGLRQRQPQGASAPNGAQGAPNGAQGAPQTPERPTGQAQAFSPTVQSFPPPRKQWYDKLADAILGDDTAGAASSPASRYALICERCFTHNGLVTEAQWEDAQYLCPKCGHFNMSARAKKATMQQAAPAPSTAASVQSTPSAMPPSALVSQIPREPSVSSLRSHEPAHKSPLSESTVMVEKEDAEEKKVQGYEVTEDAEEKKVQGYEVTEDASTRMDVDS
ncbi:hypothetical protein M422DRAFT_52067 [Sphaerobolus stellatus SS14]|uniref:Endoplasmic reticulum junction formation protein lunapark n=1 Tax=Sphaerobolus stellatus (strain SS14) TaxID=990650 RepID=A0A0C9TVA9_SPHS4|nr:hypothetical protein M422DRAFT_52067 [Sphaerobolus stellatus SS14]